MIVFFVLSGFLITSILLATRDKPRYFHNFHARRALRIWPVYLLLLVVVYLNAPWFIGPPVWEAIKTAPWLAYIFCVQNLFHITLPPAIGPTWALAIEEQYYFVWAPLVRFLRRPWMLAALLAGALAGSPLLRHANLHWMTPTNTLIHLDGIAWGSLLAIGLHTLPLSRRAWLWMGLGGFVLGIAAAGTVAGGTAYLDSALAVGFAGAALALIASSGARNPLNAALRQRTAGLLRAHQLRPLHDAHFGVYLFRLVRRAHERLWHSGQPGGGGVPPDCDDSGGYCAVVRI